MQRKIKISQVTSSDLMVDKVYYYDKLDLHYTSSISNIKPAYHYAEKKFEFDLLDSLHVARLD